MMYFIMGMLYGIIRFLIDLHNDGKLIKRNVIKSDLITNSIIRLIVYLIISSVLWPIQLIEDAKILLD